MKPEIVGEVVDRSYVVSWRDTDRASITSTVTFDVHFTASMPPTWPLGVVPMGLTGDFIAVAVPEADRTNEIVWDTSRVPSGSYFIWTLGNEDPPDTNPPLTIVAFSRGVVTVAHPGDPVHPSVILPQPDGPFTTADAAFEIEYEAFDPDGTGRVKLEATQSRNGTGLILVADGLPAMAQGKYVWDTKNVPSADWTLKATITDARGLSFTAWSRFFLLIDHPTPLAPDAGADSGPVGPAADAGTPPAAADGGVSRAEDGGLVTAEPSSCGCTSAAGGGPGFLMVLVVLILGLPALARSGFRTRRSDSGRTPDESAR